ncbi:hypothetical protein [Niabella ginsengisoli]|uniref:Addiction module protein n=1 Tax=Niabella ginsengisoli TaxID=522298 RepID=A0ABS9SDZ5_9BACT|nr:hypothetical protein [Niabella ginsengisoli]MCH5596581.1 hypothetical protein [Niabella ginsengisoli]
MANVLEKEWNSYFMQLNETEKKSVLQMLRVFLNGRKKNSEEKISIEQYNRELDEAMARIDNGEFITMDELEKDIQSW